MRSELDREGEIGRLLRVATAEDAPEASPDLIQRTIGRVRRLILFGELVRFVALEALWGDHGLRQVEAESLGERERS
jgi:hypothetical protein